ncbi:MAG: glycosyltransferase family 2 protein [Cyclobacteriaceae bacterium]|nr:glycosyltransferase family 2 protein [Cyclobacteriaceae bacterium]
MIVVMPMAGRGSRFSQAGVDTPKPLIDVCGKPMFSWAVKSLEGVSYSRFVAVVLQEHQDQFDIEGSIKKYVPGDVSVICIPEVTAGQLCTVLAAKEEINTPEDVLIIPSDTLVVSSLARDINGASPDCKGIISVAQMPGDHWSFAKVGDQDRVTEVAEKVRISEYASTGLYYFRHGHEFVEIAEEMVRQKEKTRGEYYVIPVYNKYLDRSWEVKVSHAQELWDMGNPTALENFEEKFG